MGHWSGNTMSRVGASLLVWGGGADALWYILSLNIRGGLQTDHVVLQWV